MHERLNKTFMMISNWKKNISTWFIPKIFQRCKGFDIVWVKQDAPVYLQSIMLSVKGDEVWGGGVQARVGGGGASKIPVRSVVHTQSTVQPVPTRHRQHACIKMQTALSGNTRTWPNVVSILVQGRWWGGQYWNSIGSNPGLHTGVCLHPPLPSIIFSLADQGTFSKTAGQSQSYYNTWNWEWGTYDVTHLQILTCEVAVSTAGSVVVPGSHL